MSDATDDTSSAITCRTACEADLPAMLAIYNWEIENGTATCDLEPQTLDERRAWLQAHNVGNHPLIVAEAGDGVVGYASLSTFVAKHAYDASVELSVYVDHDHQRQGIGRILMGEILRIARERGDVHAVLSLVTSGNAGSQRLHEEFGFTLRGTMLEVGKKFGRSLDVDYYELIIGE